MVHFFNEDGLGAIINSSRGIIAAYKQEQYASFGSKNFGDAARRLLSICRKTLRERWKEEGSRRHPLCIKGKSKNGLITGRFYVSINENERNQPKRRSFRELEAYKQEFIEFMVDCGVLQFGDFTLKSGRKSPFL